MRIGIIGRGSPLYQATKILLEKGHEIVLIVAAKEAPEYGVTLSDYEALAANLNAKFFYTPKLNESAEFREWISHNPVDLGLSMNYVQVIADEVIRKFRLGILNVHAGDLPKYRGNACQAWAILNGEKKIGLCVHKMIGGAVDRGDIIARDYFPLDDHTTIADCYRWIDRAGVNLMIASVEKISENNNYILESSNLSNGGFRCYPRTPDDGRINWRDSAVHISRLVRASSEPYPGAFCFLDSKKLIVWRATLQDDGEKYFGIPGQVAFIGQNGDVGVLTGEGKIILSDVELDGNRTKPAAIIKSARSRLE